jgi:hypothetical protein
MAYFAHILDAIFGEIYVSRRKLPIYAMFHNLAETKGKGILGNTFDALLDKEDYT